MKKTTHTTMIKPLMSSNDYIGYSLKKKLKPLLREYWSFRWKCDLWQYYISFFYQDKWNKNEKMMRLMIDSEPWPFLQIETWDSKKMEFHEINNERNVMIICQWLIRMELLEPLIEWCENSCWKEWHDYMPMFDLEW